jgi:hypothetical protein
LYSEESPVGLDKVSFDGITISAGLRAKRRILASSPVLSTSSSLSSDLIPGHLRSISVIESGSGQKGPRGPRLMLGPLRFANHDCQPNTQVRKGVVRRKAMKANLCILQFKSVKNSHAYLLMSIKDIESGEPITVKYTEDKTYFPEGCGCKTCNPQNPPEAPRHREIEETLMTEEVVGGKKSARRGGGRRRKAKRQRKECET